MPNTKGISLGFSNQSELIGDLVRLAAFCTIIIGDLDCNTAIVACTTSRLFCLMSLAHQLHVDDCHDEPTSFVTRKEHPYSCRHQGAD